MKDESAGCEVPASQSLSGPTSRATIAVVASIRRWASLVLVRLYAMQPRPAGYPEISDVVVRQRPIRWFAGEFWPVCALSAAVVGVLLVCAGRYGFHRDEFYIRESGRHLPWGIRTTHH